MTCLFPRGTGEQCELRNRRRVLCKWSGWCRRQSRWLILKILTFKLINQHSYNNCSNVNEINSLFKHFLTNFHEIELFYSEMFMVQLNPLNVITVNVIMLVIVISFSDKIKSQKASLAIFSLVIIIIQLMSLCQSDHIKF